MHHRIAHDHRLENAGRLNARFGGERRCQPVDRLAHNAGHILVTAGVHHRIGDAAHQILAKADLGIHHAGGAEHLARHQIAQMRGDGGRAQIDCQTVKPALVQSRPDVEQAGRGAGMVTVERHGHLPVALAQHRLQLGQHRQIRLDIVDLPLFP